MGAAAPRGHERTDGVVDRPMSGIGVDAGKDDGAILNRRQRTQQGCDGRGIGFGPRRGRMQRHQQESARAADSKCLEQGRLVEHGRRGGLIEAGRAARGDTPGIVLIQTINPDHYAIRCAAAQNYEMFYSKEIEFRRLMSYPPFTALANVVVRATREEEALTRSAALGRLLDPAPEGIKVLGPAPAAVARVKNEFRYQMLIKAVHRKRLSEVLADLRRFAAAENWNATALLIDVDPMTLL